MPDVRRAPSTIAITAVNPASKLISPLTATGTYSTDDLVCGNFTELSFDVNVTTLSGTGTPTLTFHIDRKGSDGVYYTIWTGSAITTAAPTPQSVSLGAGLGSTPVAFGNLIRIVCVASGSTVTNAVFTMSLQGK